MDRNRKHAKLNARCWATISLEASLPGEIVLSTEFYDYNAKYLDEGSQLILFQPS